MQAHRVPSVQACGSTWQSEARSAWRQQQRPAAPPLPGSWGARARTPGSSAAPAGTPRQAGGPLAARGASQAPPGGQSPDAPASARRHAAQ
eukprot:13858598-Alexandrium_andersonii.AAC.1